MPKRKEPKPEREKGVFLPGRPISLKILGDYLIFLRLRFLWC